MTKFENASCSVYSITLVLKGDHHVQLGEVVCRFVSQIVNMELGEMVEKNGMSVS